MNTSPRSVRSLPLKASGTEFPAQTNPTQLTVAGGKAFFTEFDPATGVELWATDGTAAGTQMVSDLRPGATGSNPSSLAAVGNQLFFFARTSSTASGIYVTDGTDGGTTVLKPMGSASSTTAPTLKAISAVFRFMQASLCA